MDLIYRKMDSYDPAVNRSASTDDDGGDVFSVSPDIPGPKCYKTFYSCNLLMFVISSWQTFQDWSYVFEYPRAYPRAEFLKGGSLG
jgi:hypothetical protein